MRSGNVMEEEKNQDMYGAPKKTLDNYEQIFAQKTHFFSTYHPDAIEETLIESLQKIGVKSTVNAGKYKIKFSMLSKDQSG